MLGYIIPVNEMQHVCGLPPPAYLSLRVSNGRGIRPGSWFGLTADDAAPGAAAALPPLPPAAAAATFPSSSLSPPAAAVPAAPAVTFPSLFSPPAAAAGPNSACDASADVAAAAVNGSVSAGAAPCPSLAAAALLSTPQACVWHMPISPSAAARGIVAADLQKVTTPEYPY